MFKNKLQIIDSTIPYNDEDIISFESEKLNYYTYDTVYINLFTCFHNLTRIDMGSDHFHYLTGDISDLVSLKKLSVIDFYKKRIYGNIENLKSPY